MMRDRLVDLINEAKDEYPTTPTVNCCKPTFAYYLADRLLENGVIVPPCKVGDVIYLPWQFDGLKGIAYLRVTHVIFESEKNYVVTDFETDNQIYYDKYKGGAYEFEDFGKTVFLTRDEAEQAMKGEHHAEIH